MMSTDRRPQVTDLPTGTVTFLFSDIEGSTKLVRRLGDRYREVLEAHDAIVRAALQDSGGVEVRTEGDSFFAVFAVAGRALGGAAEIQRRLAAHAFPDAADVRVRMGLHTGEAQLGGDNYIGLDVHRAARIASAAHGGQVLLSEATRALVAPALPSDVSLRDMGEHRLKDLAHPERLWQAAIAGLRADFPPPRTLDARPSSLPTQLTSFVGRQDDIAAVTKLLSQHRLVTLTGPGGTGKTRLALQVAGRELLTYADGAFFADLSMLNDPTLVPAAVAAALGVPADSARPRADSLADHLAEKQILLILDNLEQVVEAAPEIEALLMGAPRIRVLATSRSALQIRGEQEYALVPLAVPELDRLPDLAELAHYEGVRLFVERAQAVKPAFSLTDANAVAVAGICARLEGLPLAIELAASRVKLITPQEILTRMGHRLDLLEGGTRTLPERQRTLRGAIDWSYDLLDAADRRLFARLSVFVGGCTLEAAEAVCDLHGDLGADVLAGLASLADKSLVRQVDAPDGESRLAMLETIREYARERLEDSGEAAALRLRHAEFFLALALEAEPHLTSSDQGEWLDRCEREHDNLRAALRRGSAAGLVERVQLAAAALWRFWQQRGHIAEGRRHLEQALACGAGEPAAARAAALTGAGGIAYWQNDYAATEGFYSEALAIRRRLGEPIGIAEALYNLSFVPLLRGDADAAEPLIEEAQELYRGARDLRGQAQTLGMLAFLKLHRGDFASARSMGPQLLALWRRIGDRYEEANTMATMAMVERAMGDFQQARAQLLRALAIYRDAGNQMAIGMALIAMGGLAIDAGRPEEAAELAGASAAVRERLGGGVPPEWVGLLGLDPEDSARAQLGDERFTRMWRQGYEADADQLVADLLLEVEGRFDG